jgi:ABC-type lipoprotein export system ATPase subunit
MPPTGATNLGFVFQDFNLLDTFSMRDNIHAALGLSAKPHGEMERACCRLTRSCISPSCSINSV